MEKIDKKIKAVSQAIKELKRVKSVTPEFDKVRDELEKLSDELEQTTTKEQGAWSKVLLARQIERPKAQFYIEHMVKDFIPCHGDRQFGDDPAITGGIGKIGEHVVTIIGQNKGTTAKENIAVNFGMPHPEGYRKALRLMKQAEKFKRPVVCLVDTPGAYCGLGAEERGQGEAIARNLMEMSCLKVPILSVVIGEGGSGGALALALADRISMLEHAIYSILSPEGFASILWKDAARAKEAAEIMKLTAQELFSVQMIDHIIQEPIGGGQNDPMQLVSNVENYLISELESIKKENIEQLVNKRYEKFRKYGSIS